MTDALNEEHRRSPRVTHRASGLLTPATFIVAGLTLAFAGGLRAWQTHRRATAWQPVEFVLIEKRVSAQPLERWARVRYRSDDGTNYEREGDLFPDDPMSFASGQRFTTELQAMRTDQTYVGWCDRAHPGDFMIDRGSLDAGRFTPMIIAGIVTSVGGSAWLVRRLTKVRGTSPRPVLPIEPASAASNHSVK